VTSFEEDNGFGGFGILLVIVGAWFYYYSGVPGIKYGSKPGNSNTVSPARPGSVGEVNYGHANGISVEVLYASQVHGIRTVESMTQNYIDYMYVYPSDGYIGYLFKVYVKNEDKIPASMKFYLITKQGRKILPVDNTDFATYTEILNGPVSQESTFINIPRDVLCNAIRIPVKFSYDKISRIDTNTSLTMFLYYSVEIGDKPVSLYVEGKYLDVKSFNFTVPLNFG
jgi:hypothetical protein